MTQFLRTAALVLVVGSLATFGGFVLGRRSAQRSLGQSDVAVVNGNPIKKYELDTRNHLFQTRSLELLAIEKIFTSKLRDRNISIKPINPGSLDEWDRYLESLLAQLALADVSDDKFRKVHSEFQESLSDCNPEIIFFHNHKDAEAFLEGYQAGESFQACATKRGFFKPVRETLGPPPYTEYLLSRVFGPQYSRSIFKLPNGKISKVMSLGEEFALVEMREKRSSYEELLPKIKDIVARSRKQLVLESVASQADLSTTIPMNLRRTPHALEVLPKESAAMKPLLSTPQAPPAGQLPTVDPKQPAFDPAHLPGLKPSEARPESLPSPRRQKPKLEGLPMPERSPVP